MAGLDRDAPLDDRVARHARDLDLPIDEAWTLIGTTEGLASWLGERVDLEEVEPGARGTVVDAEEVLATEIESVEPGRRVSLRWWSQERGATVVDLTLDPIDGTRTRLVVVEVPVRLLQVPACAGGVRDSRRHGSGPQLASTMLALA